MPAGGPEFPFQPEGRCADGSGETTTMHLPSTNQRPLLNLLAAGLATLGAARSASAADVGGIAIHGSLSATASYSDQYNYLGDTRDSLDLNQTELILNGTKQFDNGLKAAAQIYAYELAGYEDLTIDFANLDYSFRQEIGVRVGRNKLPAGFYNDVQDLDQVRVFASLPLNFYPRTFRAISASYDGGALYGNVPAGKAGSLDYQVFGGVGRQLDEEMPFMESVGATKLVPGTTYGFALAWNLPVDGLRAGYSYQRLPGIDIELGFPRADVDYVNQIASVEYTRGKWIVTAEYKHVEIDNEVTNFPVPASHSEEDHSYLQVTYQATDKLGLGIYYAYSDFSDSGVDRDTAFAACYALQPWWLVKAELHLMDGINNLDNAGDPNPGASDDTWNYLVLKTTLSF
jgi:predicted porin